MNGRYMEPTYLGDKLKLQYSHSPQSAGIEDLSPTQCTEQVGSSSVVFRNKKYNVNNLVCSADVRLSEAKQEQEREIDKKEYSSKIDQFKIADNGVPEGFNAQFSQLHKNLSVQLLNAIDCENSIVCSQSILSIVAICCLGATENIRKQFADVLSIDPVSIPCFQNKTLSTLPSCNSSTLQSSSNFLFALKNFHLKQPFKNECRKYSSSIMLHDDIDLTDSSKFQQIISQLNEHLTKMTGGVFKEVLKNEAEIKNGVLIKNMSSFIGAWQKEFDENCYIQFHKPDGQKIDFASGMSVQGEHLKYFLEQSGWSVCKIPFEENKYCFIVAMPKDIANADLKKGIENILNANLYKTDKKFELIMPKFELSNNINLKECFNKTAIGRLLTDNLLLQSVVENAKSLIFDIQHQAMLALSNKGALAIAATSLRVSMSIRQCSQYLRVNRPFYFFIVNQQENVILYTGKVSNPEPPSQKSETMMDRLLP